MANEGDIVSAKVKAQLDTATGSGELEASTRSRFIGALDRLLGAFFDLPATWLDAKSQNIEHEAELKRQFKTALAAPVLEATAAGDHEKARLLGLRAASEYREFEKTVNLAGVAQKATAALTDGTGSNEAKVEAEIDEEWLNKFQHFASGASTEEMRSLWGRILADETLRPGSYSASSLRFVFELDNSMAEICERFARRNVDGYIYTTKEDQSGAPLDEALILQAAGLIVGVGTHLQRTLDLREDKSFAIVDGHFALTGTRTTSDPVSLPMYVVTKLGKEIFSLLPEPSPKEKLRLIAQQLMDTEAEKFVSLSLVELGGETAPGRRAIIGSEPILVEQKKSD